MIAALNDRVVWAIRAGRAKPAFGFYLLAVAALPLKWASPLARIDEQAIWSDVFVGVAFAVWIAAKARSGRASLRLPRWQLALAAYLLLAAVSAAAALSEGATVVGTIVLMVELAALAAMTADFTADLEARQALVTVVVGTVIVTAGLVVVALAFFYAGVDTSLIWSYGDLEPSSGYARVAAGFYSAPLLGSYCIFASALVADPESGLSKKTRAVTQIVLALVCLVTFSRAIVGFAIALALRELLPRRSRGATTLAIGLVIGSIAILAALTAGTLSLDPTRPTEVTYTVSEPGPRREAFDTALDSLGQHPVLGTGPGTLPAISDGRPFRAHFTPLNVAATTGLPALVALLAMFALLWRDRRRPTELAGWSGLLGLGIEGLGSDVDHHRHVWILIGLLGRPAEHGPRESTRPGRRDGL
jgi:hypothetical protein